MSTACPEETAVFTAHSIAVRRATDSDRDVLERLAALDDAPVPSGDVLIASVDDEPQAAIAVASGVSVADPFRPTADLVELLELRAARLRGRSDERRGLLRALRSAYRTA